MLRPLKYQKHLIKSETCQNSKDFLSMSENCKIDFEKISKYETLASV